jgi:DNA-binding response OmpR family regulator
MDMKCMNPPSEPGRLHLLHDRSAVRVGTREVVITPTQVRILAVLLSEPNRAFSRAELVEKGIGDLVSERTIDVHIKELRRKLEGDGWRIETVRGRGYCYRPEDGHRPADG